LSLGSLLVGVALALLLHAPPARAAESASEGPIVSVFSEGERPTDGPSALVQAELRAAGFRVRPGAIDGAMGPRRLDHSVGGDAATLGAVWLRWEGDAVVASVWLRGRSGQEAIVREIPASGRDEGAWHLLALRVSEFVYARALELGLTPKRLGEDAAEVPVSEVNDGAPPLPTPGESSVAVAEPERVPEEPEAEPEQVPEEPESELEPPEPALETAPRPTRWALGAGLGVLGGPGGVPLSFAPAGLFSVRLTEVAHLELLAVAPAFAEVQNRAGSAELDQELLVLRGRFLLPDRALAPYLVASLGGYRMGARGHAVGPGLEGASASGFAFASLMGLGLRWAFAPQFRMILEGNVGFVAPRPVLRFAGADAARTGAPLVVSMVAMEYGW
jgi:hypothetical protein